MIELRNISKSYGHLEVLHGVSLDILPGQLTAIVGPSGAGKSTLLHIIGSLDRPDSGSVKFDGIETTTLTAKGLAEFRNRNIGFVFQSHLLLPEFTIEENVMLPALIGGTSRKEASRKARELLDRMGLADRLTHRPNALSGGECQRAAVARALINSPAVILADEPSGSLDSDNRATLHRLFFNLREELGTTLVIVTHDSSLAKDADSVITICDGSIAEPAINTNQNQLNLSISND